MPDRLIRGSLAGALLGFWVLANDLFWKNVMHFTKGSWLDGLAYLVLGHTAKGLPDYLAGALGQIVFTGMLGGLYVRYIVPTPGEGHYALRGLGYGAVAWFVTLAITAIYHVPQIGVIEWQTAFATFFSAVTWGLFLGWVFRRWEVCVPRR